MFSSSLPKTILRMLAVLALLGFGAWYFWQYQNTKKELDALTAGEQPAASETAQPSREEIIAAVARHTELPTDEQPLILNIEQAQQLAERQPLFQGAIDGDIALIYVQAALGVVYSPSRDMVVNSGPLTIQANIGEATAAPSATVPAEQ